MSSEPSTPIDLALNNPSTETKPTACVIGAGISGVSSALFLAKKGYQVTVLDQRDKIADGATTSASGVLTSAPVPRLSYWHISKQHDSFVTGLYQITTFVASKSNIAKSFGDNFSKFSGRAAAAIQTSHLASLGAANRLLALEIINKDKLDVPYQNGEITVNNSAESDNLLSSIMNHSLRTSPTQEAINLDIVDCFRLFPPSVLKDNKPRSSCLYPNSVVLNPTQFTTELGKECERLGVKFDFNTRVLELKPNTDGTKIESLITKDGEYKADQYVVAAGFPSATLCDIGEEGTLSPVIPVKSYALTIRETTDHRTVKNWLLPTFLPCYPTRYLNDRSETEGRKPGTTMFPAAVMMGEQMIRFEADPINPRIYRVITGNEYHNINTQLSQSLTEIVVDKMKKITPINQFAADDIKAGTGYSSRRIINEASREIVGNRSFSMKKPIMGLHCAAMDGLPLAGKTHKYDNLYLNTAHGTDPMNTAIISGHTVAQIMKNDYKHKEPFYGIQTTEEIDTKDAFFVDPRIIDPKRFSIQPVQVEHVFDFTNQLQ